ncbi:MAG: recombination mediator RecR [Rikenellaceae bacterium]|nr:recombination mediator RecR [Rikenellaceae bacterium]
MSKLLNDAVAELSKLPGVGKRTAMRLAIHLLRTDKEEVAIFSETITRFRNEIKYCVHCNNLSDGDICPICADSSRDRGTVCVVENIKDVISIENSQQYKGLYHVLGGIISPMQGIGPSDLKIDLLADNISRGGIKEVIMALSTSVEGETTAFYICRKLSEFKDLKITTLARGIGFGDELEYADELTIGHAIHNRKTI